MTIKQTLASMVLAGAVAFGSAGCRNPSQYTFNGKIDKESVTFERNLWNSGERLEERGILTVTKPDGRVIKYISNSYLELESVKIISNGDYGTTYDASNKLNEPIFEQAQRQFDGYLPLLKTAHDQQKKEWKQERIKEEQQRIKDNPQRIKQALEDLK